MDGHDDTPWSPSCALDDRLDRSTAEGGGAHVRALLGSELARDVGAWLGHRAVPRLV